jgi:hypothetical protein
MRWIHNVEIWEIFGRLKIYIKLFRNNIIFGRWVIDPVLIRGERES